MVEEELKTTLGGRDLCQPHGHAKGQRNCHWVRQLVGTFSSVPCRCPVRRAIRCLTVSADVKLTRAADVKLAHL